MNKTRIQHFDAEEGEEKLLSHYRITTNQYGQDIPVPVVDVRDGISYRILAYNMIKASNRSKYMNYNQYHTSPKKQTRI
jgi:hypothetical protein